MLTKFIASRFGLLTPEQASAEKRLVEVLTAAEAQKEIETAREKFDAELKAAKTILPEHMQAYAGAHEFNVPDPSIYENQADLMAKVAYLYTVVTLTAQSAAKQDFDIYKRDKEVTGHPLESLLKAPNPMQTGFEFLRDHFTYILLNKQCYWWTNRTSESAEPSELWIIPPGNMKPELDEQLGIKHYLYYPGDGQEIIIPTWQVIWFRGFHPSNMYASLSPIEPLNLTIQTDLETQKFLRTVYGKNSGRLPGIIAFKSPVSDPDWKQIKKDVTRASEDRNYMLLRGVGDGITWLQAAASISEMETLKGRQMTREDIYNAIAPGLYNMTDVSATEANAKVGKETFAEFTLQPLFVDTSQKINKELAPVYGPFITLEFDNPVPKDVALEMAETEQYSRFATVNEVRVEKLKLEPLPADDPRGLLFVAQVGSLPAEPIPAEPAALPPALPIPQAPATQAEQVSQDEAELSAELMKCQRYAVKSFGNPKAAPVDFRLVPPALAVRIIGRLRAAQKAEEIPAIFAEAAQDVPLILLAKAIDRSVTR